VAVPLRTMRIIWGALLFAVLIYCSIAFTIGQRNAGVPFASEFKDLLVQIIYAVAAVMFGVAFFMRGWMRDRGRPAHLYNIVTWALLEAVTIYGLVLAMVKFDWRLIVAPALATFAGFVLTFPQEAV
jgi:FtsH-binding integral membrane protein